MPDQKKIFLCHRDEMLDQSCRGFTLSNEDSEGQITPDVLLVSRDTEVFAYVNSCPHTGVNLDWQENDFLDYTRQYIQCSVHGAQFRIDDGFCIYGPCNGQSLSAVRLCIEDNMIYLLLPS